MPATFLNTFQRRAHGAGLPTNLSTAGSRRILIARRFGRSSQLHEDSVIQQYYIATKSSPADDRARGLKYGTLFSVFDHLGDIRTSGLGEQALFFQGTRHLSEMVLRLWNARPMPLSSTIETNNFIFSAHLTNLDVSHLDGVVIPRGTLHLQRSKFLWPGGCYEEFAFANYGLSPLFVPFAVTLDADFADIFEVRGMQQPRKGQRLENQVKEDKLLLSYKGLDNTIRQTHIQCDPVPKSVSAGELQFELHLQPGQNAIFQLAISCDSGAVHDSIGYRRAKCLPHTHLPKNARKPIRSADLLAGSPFKLSVRCRSPSPGK
jgi:hypothetical protein